MSLNCINRAAIVRTFAWILHRIYQHFIWYYNRRIMANILVLHGPNLNLLGTREPEIYGATTLADIDALLVEQAKSSGHELSSLQSNDEAVLVTAIQDALNRDVSNKVDYIIINPAAFTHTSVAMRDALAAVNIPFIEVHLSNVHAREDFRRHSYFSDLAQGVISGLGATGYSLALTSAIKSIA